MPDSYRTPRGDAESQENIIESIVDAAASSAKAEKIKADAAKKIAEQYQISPTAARKIVTATAQTQAAQDQAEQREAQKKAWQTWLTDAAPTEVAVLSQLTTPPNVAWAVDMPTTTPPEGSEPLSPPPKGGLYWKQDWIAPLILPIARMAGAHEIIVWSVTRGTLRVPLSRPDALRRALWAADLPIADAAKTLRVLSLIVAANAELIPIAEPPTAESVLEALHLYFIGHQKEFMLVGAREHSGKISGWQEPMFSRSMDRVIEFLPGALQAALAGADLTPDEAQRVIAMSEDPSLLRPGKRWDPRIQRSVAVWVVQFPGEPEPDVKEPKSPAGTAPAPLVPSDEQQMG